MTRQEGLPSVGATADEHDAWTQRLVCPTCEAPLRHRAEELQCPECRKIWPIVNGVPHFIQDFPYWGEIPLEPMLAVNQQAGKKSWKDALLGSSDLAVQQAAEMILNLERANWQWLLNLGPDSRVLDLGAGMGATSHALGKHYSEVVALEPVLERVEFMRHRFSQEKLSNIKILRSSLWSLPFEKESFDLVAMNGVLEWVAQGQSGDPSELQERALRQVLHVLRPGGYLYLGIENRLSPGYFIGYPDPHCGLPFVTILPRRLAHWYARKKGHRDGYRNYLYSSRGYRKLLHKAGFTHLEVYLALPSYNHPRFLIPLKGSIFSYYSRSFNVGRTSRLRAILHGLLLKLRLLHNFQYSFAILARK